MDRLQQGLGGKTVPDYCYVYTAQHLPGVMVKRLLMKYVAIIVALSFFVAGASAMCLNRGIYVWPRTDTINLNPIVSIEGYYEDQAFVRKLGKGLTVYLMSADGDKMPLERVQLNEGGYKLTQVIFKTKGPLLPGKRYGLFVDGLPNDMRDCPFYGKDKKSWVASGPLDLTPPKFGSQPTETSKTYIQYGCGPAVYVNFDVAAVEQSDYLVKVEVVDENTADSRVYWVAASDGLLRLGHGMCSGEFALQSGKKYFVRFGLVDASGNHSLETTSYIAFTAPTK